VNYSPTRPMTEPPTSDPTLRTLTVAEAGRLDKAVTAGLADLSRARVQALIEAGLVVVDGRTVVEPAGRVKPGATVVVTLPPPEPARVEGEDIALDIVHEDEDVLVIDKPAGLVVHPAPGNRTGTLVNALIAHCGDTLSGIGGVIRPGIVHRLDKDTSGLMVVAKNDAAHAMLKDQFQERTLSRVYKAVVIGTPWPRRGEVDAPIGRHPTNRRKMAVSDRGKPALTRYRVLESYGGDRAALVECQLATGRTHQIRVHMASLGHGLLGDPLYGSREVAGLRFPRQALHAAQLSFIHPATSQPVRFSSELPNDIRELIRSLEALE